MEHGVSVTRKSTKAHQAVPPNELIMLQNPEIGVRGWHNSEGDTVFTEAMPPGTLALLAMIPGRHL